MSGISHRFQFRVYYEDTDHGGVVYYANYLKFMERGRTEYLRAANIELDEVESNDGVMFAVTEACCLSLFESAERLNTDRNIITHTMRFKQNRACRVKIPYGAC